MIMVACKQNNAKTKGRVAQVTAELTSRMQNDWHKCVFNLVGDLADSVLSAGGEDKPGKKKKSDEDDEGVSKKRSKKEQHRSDGPRDDCWARFCV